MSPAANSQNDKIMAAYPRFRELRPRDKHLGPGSSAHAHPAPRLRRSGVSEIDSTVVAGDIQTAGIPGVTAYTDTHDIFDFTK